MGIEVWSYQTDCLDQRMSTAAMDKVVCKAMYIGLIKKLANCPNTDLLRQFLAELNLRARRKNADFWKCKANHLVCPSFQAPTFQKY